MARLRDAEKRTKILETAKALFARKGYFNTSISDIVSQSRFSVGTIYTYFSSKEEIVRTIVDEGWDEFRSHLTAGLQQRGSVEERLASLVDVFLPELLEDLSLITILLSEAVEFTRLEHRIHELRQIIDGLIEEAGGVSALSDRELETALMVYFLGILHSARVCRSTSVDVDVEDVLGFVRGSIEDALGVSLPRVAGTQS